MNREIKTPLTKEMAKKLPVQIIEISAVVVLPGVHNRGSRCSMAMMGFLI